MHRQHFPTRNTLCNSDEQLKYQTKSVELSFKLIKTNFSLVFFTQFLSRSVEKFAAYAYVSDQAINLPFAPATVSGVFPSGLYNVA